jgi:hypothetical protein
MTDHLPVGEELADEGIVLAKVVHQDGGVEENQA